ncbi:precorrin-3B synthase [Paraburkholderia sp. GAS38]|uniref:precorrin-3B synthase n=1 Tax=Paraburkholderia sp. GAS38 TaxID=3035133 RepID=UPI003D19614D
MNHASSSFVTPVTARPSACPGLLRIVAALDGGICRVKLPGGVLRSTEARAIAEASEQHAAGVIEVTNRANLQIRGVMAGHEAALIETLVNAGLGPTAGLIDAANYGAAVALDASTAPTVSTTTTLLAASAADDVRNLMISPSAGRDPQALFDTRALAAQILALLQSEPRFAALSPKFALLLDGGEQLAMLDHPHDVWLAATAAPEGVRFAFGLAGCPPVARADDRGRNAKPGTPALAAVLPSRVPALVNALLQTFLDLAAPDDTRMRHLLAAHPVEAVLQHTQTYLDFPLNRDPALADWHRAPADASLRLGAHPQRMAGTWQAGGQPPLGRLDAATLRALATIAEDSGDATLHMTPWQSVLLPDIAAHSTASVLTRLAALGLACEATQPLARLIACAGSTGCAKSQADTKADALRLAALLPPTVEQVHLSGCPRSCAAAHRAPYTLLAVAPRHYDLYRRDDDHPGFGQCVAHHLTIEQAADALARLARSPFDA